jgi:hypothetical protein
LIAATDRAQSQFSSRGEPLQDIIFFNPFFFFFLLLEISLSLASAEFESALATARTGGLSLLNFIDLNRRRQGLIAGSLRIGGRDQFVGVRLARWLSQHSLQ